ncbi:DNA phosphorothioation-dependent restriction protein DptF [Staphylococcus simulans ACS-120-V-Sch1]|uniref:DNA phosphorothioation-dependent restriction protein DptF n=2 Tax=Staphylococcus simulans TaxID=1286 RepID=UPI0002992CBC|nr:DNA phosphorothioation-dependent restriction protein DptF [Staphylococcus simulans]EKS26928.1 DNA phosphorothioation-dependent restriction protein DptF [Staphylococcus simulans ACS-120-V-Sch1]MDQ7114316.1 DNA phosphorothioation-dependent restriction protein DptF [Staphylococcus simulans]MDQ7140018.1 DNA phosphorothioation-dependent restriction protein DptF [Staphylococcus simulans]WML98612.1 DNA phosphorothioation-dependent restriction protein DptF [Staphylococcus simulans]WMM05027.1 DNA ph
MELKMLEEKLFRSLKENEIAIKDYSIDEINVTELNTKILRLKMEKVIDNTTFEILRNIKNAIADFKRFNDINSKSEIENQLTKLERYTKKKSFTTSNNFEEIMKHLSVTSKESIVNSQAFTEFNDYLHIERPIEHRLISSLKSLKEKDSGIILLVGSVGDGKSHLLAYLNDKYAELMQDITIYNDATESDNPYRTAQETLINIFRKYKENGGKVVIAINIGMLHKLNESFSNHQDLSHFKEMIESTHIFSEVTADVKNNLDEEISIVSFIGEKPFEINENGMYSTFYNEVMEKIFRKELDNPIYAAFMDDDGFNRTESIYRNYKLMMNQDVRKAVIHLLIKIQIENKRIISTRALLNFIHDIIVPDNNHNNNLLMNLLFESSDRSPLLKAISSQDPSKIQNYKIDKLNVELYNSLDIYGKSRALFGEEVYKEIEDYITLFDGLKYIRKFKMIIRLHFLFNYKEYENDEYEEYIQMLRCIENDRLYKKSLLSKLQKAIYHWNGSPKEGFIYNENFDFDSNMRIGLELKYDLVYIKVTDQYAIKVEIDVNGKKLEVVIDFNLYKLLCKIEKGYIVKAKDKKDSIVFSEFVEKILNESVSKEKTIISLIENNKKYQVQKGFLGYEIKEVK